MPQQPTVLIIGAGMAGLAAGCYARLNGFPTTIIEQHHRAGGLCQSWQRGAFNINGCVHWLVGSSGEGHFPGIWRDLGVLPQTRFYNHDRLLSVALPQGKLHLYADPDRLEEHLLDQAPEDARAIGALCGAIRVLKDSDFGQPADEEGFRALLGQVRMFFTQFPAIRHGLRWWRMSIGEFAASLRNPGLRMAFAQLWHAEMSMITVVMTLAFLARRDAGYPLGGSSELIDRVVDRYEGLGGTIRYGQRVDSILVRRGRARGVRLTNGEKIRADYVISAADAQATLYSMLRGKYLDRQLLRAFDSMTPFPSLLYAGLGVRRIFPDWEASVMGTKFLLDPPQVIGGRIRHDLDVQAYTFDASLAPPEHTLLVVSLESDFDFWHDKAMQYARYQAFKQQTLNQIVEALERFYPGIAEEVLVRDLATPVTFHQYTGNYRGSYEGWLPTPEALRTRPPKTLAGLDHFYLAGHWVEPGGGLPPAALSGRKVVQAICRREGRPFRTQPHHHQPGPAPAAC